MDWLERFERFDRISRDCGLERTARDKRSERKAR